MIFSVACGIFLIDKNDKLLIVHPTNYPESMWSIPKGLRKGRDYDDFTAAQRELLEETGIDITDIDIFDVFYLGDVTYNRLKNKRLVGFACKLDFEINHKLRCDSYVDSKGTYCCFGMVEADHGDRQKKEPFPEVDRFRWVDFQEAMRLLPLSQKRLLGVYLDNYARPWGSKWASICLS